MTNCAHRAAHASAMRPKVGSSKPASKVAPKVVSAASKSIDDLPLSPGVAKALRGIQAEIGDVYRERFIEMIDVLRQQTSTLARIQETLHILVQAVAPTLSGPVPVAVRVAADGENPDLASTLIVADPIGAGYTFSQADLSKALGLPNSSDVGVLVRAFKLDESDCAVTVRRGQRNRIINYHPRAVEALSRLVQSPPANVALKKNEIGALKRVQRKLNGG
ncbi:MAG: hypothetical protein JWO56_3276 [Acidobacteria bacterium]|nr:hypothetical protein [Acidobacteriota bacterium]